MMSAVAVTAQAGHPSNGAHTCSGQHAGVQAAAQHCVAAPSRRQRETAVLLRDV